MHRYDIHVPDPRLVCSASAEGRAYLGAMNAAVNFAFANRQILAARAVRALARALGGFDRVDGRRAPYEVAHNIAKMNAPKSTA